MITVAVLPLGIAAILEVVVIELRCRQAAAAAAGIVCGAPADGSMCPRWCDHSTPDGLFPASGRLTAG